MKQILTSENWLPQQPYRTQRSYEMLCRLKTSGKEDITIQSTFFVTPVGSCYNDNYILLIDRKNIIINNNEGLTILEEMALACSACLFPVCIMVNRRGEFLHIHNHPQIVEHWEAIKHQLFETYDGEVAHRYINKNNDTIHNKELLCHALKNDFFFYCYFKPLYIYYTNELDSIEKWDPADFLEVGTPIEMDQKVFYDSSVNSIRVNATNIDAKDSRSTTTISLQYTLNPEFNTIDTIKGIIIKEQGQVHIDITATNETFVKHHIEIFPDIK